MALDGCCRRVMFLGKPVYYAWQNNLPEFGTELDKNAIIEENLRNEENESKFKINMLLTDWTLYDNAWLVNGTKNTHLFYYLCQIGQVSEPCQLKLLK